MKHRLFLYAGLLVAVLSAGGCGSGGGGGGGGSAAAPPNNVPRFAYTANFNDNTVSIYTVNAATGQLRHNGYVAAGTNPGSVAVDPSGKFAYVANNGSNNVSTYNINASTGALTSVGPAVAAGTDPASVTVDPTGKFVYVANSFNGVGGNSVSAYRIDAPDGGLIRIDADPATAGIQNFPAGSVPRGITVDPAGKFLYVANGFDGAGGNSISVYAIDAVTGALTPVAGSPFAMGAGSAPRSITFDPTGRVLLIARNGNDSAAAQHINAATGAFSTGFASLLAGDGPISVAIDPSGKFVYVANNVSSDISAYTMDATNVVGAFTQIDCGGGAGCNGANFTAGINPTSVSVDPSGKFVYVANVNSDNVSTFAIDATTGALTALPTIAGRNGNLAMAMTRGTAAVVYTPKAVYVGNLASNNVSQYTVGASGVLSPMTIPTVTAGAGVISVIADLLGRYVYAGTGAATIAQFGIATDGSLAALTPATAAAGTSWSVPTAVDPMARYAYVAHQLDGNVRQYTVALDGTLAAMSTATVTAGTQPNNVIVDPTGQFVYVANAVSDNISQFTIGATGALTAMSTATVAAVDWPYGMAIHPSGRFLYVTNLNDDSISQYTIGTSGALTAMSIASVAAGAYPMSIAVDPRGRYAYVASRVGNSVSQYSISATGALTAMTIPTVTTALMSGPTAITVDQSGTYVYVANRFGGNILQFSIGADGALTPLGTASVSAGTDPVAIVTTATVQ